MLFALLLVWVHQEVWRPNCMFTFGVLRTQSRETLRCWIISQKIEMLMVGHENLMHQYHFITEGSITESQGMQSMRILCFKLPLYSISNL